ncbi:MAG: HD domain-containing protein, partial [Firmicutes bacterium]|nr:HD domain-containing protein [Bacillota bacterium]
MTSNLNSGTSIKRLTAEDCERLYSEFSTPPHVIAHCKAVGDAGALIAEALNAGGMDLDEELIRISGYAHDVMRLVDKHDERAGEMLEERGYLRESNLVMHHMSHSFYIDKAPDETDILCLADRLILEHSYSGIDKRIDYLIHKFAVTPERTERLIKAREETRRYMDKLEETMGKTFDDLFL